MKKADSLIFKKKNYYYKKYRNRVLKYFNHKIGLVILGFYPTVKHMQ